MRGGGQRVARSSERGGGAVVLQRRAAQLSAEVLPGVAQPAVREPGWHRAQRAAQERARLDAEDAQLAAQRQVQPRRLAGKRLGPIDQEPAALPDHDAPLAAAREQRAQRERLAVQPHPHTARPVELAQHHLAFELLDELHLGGARRCRPLGRAREAAPTGWLDARRCRRALQSPVVDQPLRRAQRKRRDAQRRVDAQGARHHRAVQHDQPLVPGRGAGGGVGIEHAAEVVDRAVGRVVAHRRPAQRMHGEQRPAHAAHHLLHRERGRSPQRVRERLVLEAGLAAQLVQARLAIVQRLCLAKARPADLHGAVAAALARTALQLDAALRAVVAHDRDDQRVVRRGLVEGAGVVLDAIHCVVLAIALGQREQAFAERGGFLQQPAQRPRHRQLLDHHVALRVAAAQVDHCGDGRPDGALGGRRSLVRRAIHSPRDARHDGDHVAVGGAARAERGREAQRHAGVGRARRLARAQQDLGGAERPRRQHHAPRAQPRGGALAQPQLLVGVGEQHMPQRAMALQPQHRRPGEEARPGSMRLRQQRRVQRSLRAVIAAGGAVAAVHALLQRHAGRGDRVLLQGHGDGGGLEGLRTGERAKLLELSKRVRLAGHDGVALALGTACGQRMHQPLGPVAQRRLPADLARPRARLEDRRVRPGHHAGIDERAAAQPVGLQHADVLADAHVEEPFAPSARTQPLRRAEAHLAGKIRGTRGKVAGKEFEPALDHPHAQRPVALAATRELRGRDRAPVAAAHDEQVHMRLVGGRLAVLRELGQQHLQPFGKPRIVGRPFSRRRQRRLRFHALSPNRARPGWRG